MPADFSQIIRTLKASPVVTSIQEWQGERGKRHYVRLVGFNSRANGDKSTKVYLDEAASELRFVLGKGNASSAYLASYEALKVVARTLGQACDVSFDLTVKL